jgi:hypothetical protein
MNRSAWLLVALAAAIPGPTLARDTVVHVTLQEVLDMPEAKSELDGTVKFFLAGQNTPQILSKMSDDVSNKKTNSVGKSDEFGCKWAALSALVAFQASAKRDGANAVVDLVSYYKKNVVSSPTEIECHAGGVLVGVALKGTYAKIAQ